MYLVADNDDLSLQNLSRRLSSGIDRKQEQDMRQRHVSEFDKQCNSTTRCRNILPECVGMYLAPKKLNAKSSGGFMRIRQVFLLVSCLALSILMTPFTLSFAAQPPDPQTRPHIDDELIVKFRGGRDDYSKLMTHYGVGGRRAKVFRNLAGLELVKLPRGLSVKEAIDFYRRSSDVLYAEPNYIVRTTNIPNDPRFSEQWGLQNSGQSSGTPEADIEAVGSLGHYHWERRRHRRRDRLGG
jgi:hypothetical protein